MSESRPHIAANIAVSASDIGIGAREIDYLFEVQKR
jgi:hypothetical protein